MGGNLDMSCIYLIYMSPFQTSDFFFPTCFKKISILKNFRNCKIQVQHLSTAQFHSQYYTTLKCNSYKKFYFCKNQTHPVKFVELFLTKSIVGNLSKPKEAKSINRNGNFMCKCLPLPRQLPLTWFANLHHPMSFTSAPSKSP